jgi:hypothetical protein
MRRIIYTNYKGKECKFIIEMDIDFDEKRMQYTVETPHQRLIEVAEVAEVVEVVDAPIWIDERHK